MNELERIAPGAVTDLDAQEFTAEAIVAFAGQYDPQPFHLTEEAGRASLFGGLAASGWHTAAIFGRLMAAAGIDERLVEARDLKWLKPVIAGDVLSYRSQVLAADASAEGTILTRRNEAFNARGEKVFEFIGRSVSRAEPLTS